MGMKESDRTLWIASFRFGLFKRSQTLILEVELKFFLPTGKTEQALVVFLIAIPERLLVTFHLLSQILHTPCCVSYMANLPSVLSPQKY